MTENSTSSDWFEQAWEDREEKIYPALFGSLGPGIYPLNYDTFKVFNAASVDPRWLTVGVFECLPSANRNTWLYVSSGLSNAWEAETPDPDGVSGFGVELMLECPAQSMWALLLMHRMVAFQILLGHGRYPGRPLLNLWDRIPLRSPIDGAASLLTNILVSPPLGFEGQHKLLSGSFEFLNLLGITEPEKKHAQTNDGQALFEILRKHNAAPITDPARACTISPLG
jgi:hypothetical protein